MAGKRFLINILILFCCTIFTDSASALGDQGPIAVLLSDNEISYRQPVDNFIATSPRAVKIFTLDSNIERVPKVMADIMSLKPSLIFALGAKAAYAAKVWTQEGYAPPVIFAMVINWQKFNFTSQPNIAGISYNILPGNQLIGLTIFSPEAKNIGIVYNKRHSIEYVAKARESAEMLNLKLFEAQVNRPEDFQRAYKKLSSKIDVLWIIPDPVVYTIENITWIEDRCLKDKVVCLGHSKNIATSNILLAVDPDLAGIGSQASNMAKDILNNTATPKEISVVEPISTRFIFNMKTAEKLSITPSTEALQLAAEIIE